MRDDVCLLGCVPGLLVRGRAVAAGEKQHKGPAATAADLKRCAALIPRPCLTRVIPTDQTSVGSDFVLISALATKIGFTKRYEKTFVIWSLIDRIRPRSTQLRVFFETRRRLLLPGVFCYGRVCQFAVL